jgi:hypothetical protein
MRKPQITRIESQLRQARNRAARRCSKYVEEPVIDTRNIQFNDKPEKEYRASQAILSSDREFTSSHTLDTDTTHSS